MNKIEYKILEPEIKNLLNLLTDINNKGIPNKVILNLFYNEFINLTIPILTKFYDANFDPKIGKTSNNYLKCRRDKRLKKNYAKVYTEIFNILVSNFIKYYINLKLNYTKKLDAIDKQLINNYNKLFNMNISTVAILNSYKVLINIFDIKKIDTLFNPLKGAPEIDLIIGRPKKELLISDEDAITAINDLKKDIKSGNIKEALNKSKKYNR